MPGSPPRSPVPQGAQVEVQAPREEQKASIPFHYDPGEIDLIEHLGEILVEVLPWKATSTSTRDSEARRPITRSPMLCGIRRSGGSASRTGPIASAAARRVEDRDSRQGLPHGAFGCKGWNAPSHRSLPAGKGGGPHEDERARQSLAGNSRRFVLAPAGPRRPRLHPAGPVRGLAGYRSHRRLRPVLADANWGYSGGAAGARALPQRHRLLEYRGRPARTFSITNAALTLASGQMGPRSSAQFHPRCSQQTGLGIFSGPSPTR